jgi:hypothetical protein
VRTSIEVADIFRAAGPAYRIAHAGHLSLAQLKVMSAIENCRTAALGGHVEACEDCGHWRIAYNSCRNRHCPRCQGAAARTWLAERKADLLPVGYFHVVFTLPAEVADIAFHNKTLVYARRRNEAACPHPSPHFQAADTSSPTPAADRNPHSHRLWLAGSFLGDFRTPAGARNSYMGMVNYKRHHVDIVTYLPGQSVDPFDESVCVTRFANEPSPPYIRSGRMHLFHDPACGGFGPKKTKPFFNSGCLRP